jgi:hypothetical protein
MSMPDELRRSYMDAARMTDQQVEESIGRVTIAAENERLSTASRQNLEAARDGVRQVMVDVTIIQAKYCAIQEEAGRDAREVTSPEELERDRELLNLMIADEYRLTNPFGKAEGKAETINKILSGTIRPQVWGRDGFEALETEVQVLGSEPIETVVLYGTFFMRGAGLAAFRTGETAWRDLTGRYRTTHSFVFRDGRWQETAAQMTALPDEPEFLFVGEKD